MSEIVAFKHKDGVLVVDSRLIAKELEIEHESFIKTIDKYQIYCEQVFGGLRFQIGVPSKPTGNPPRFVLLTEDQATFFMTLSRNTASVVRCKALLVSGFSKAKRLLAEQGYYQPLHTTVYIRRLERIRDHEIADDLWSVFGECAWVLLMIEKEYIIPIDKMDLCDGSIGRHWSDYRRDKEWTREVKFYWHNFQDQRGRQKCNAYQYPELPFFKKWLREIYVPTHLPKYLVDKFGKRAILQVYQEQGEVNDYILSLTEEKRLSEKQEELYQLFSMVREIAGSRNLPN